MSTSRTREKADGELFKSTGIDDNATSTAVTIDASENVLVAGSSTNPVGTNVVGHAMGSDGRVQHSTTGNTVMKTNQTTDGDIVQFRKAGSAVGSIGTYGSYATIGAVNTGLRFTDAVDAIQPHSMSTNLPTDGTTDLGRSNSRFKDAYLSGGVYLGGTGAANKLQDYETGSYNPVVQGSTSAGSFSPASNHGGRYTKIGNLVSLHFEITGTLSSAVGTYSTMPLPFVVQAGTTASVQFSYVTTPNLNHIDISVYCPSSASFGYFIIKTSSTGNPIYPNISSFMPSAMDIYGSVTYTTT